MAATRGRMKVDDATKALIRKEVRRANQPSRTVRRAPLSQTVTARPLSVSKEEIARVTRIRAQQRARRLPFLLWVWTVVVAAAVWGVSSAIAAIYGQWPATITALSSGVAVLAATGIARAVKGGTHWGGRVWLAGLAAAVTVTTAGLRGPSWQLLGFTVVATWVLGAAWWRAHRITGAAPPTVAEPADLLARYTDLFYRHVACQGGPLQGATLTDGHHTDHDTISWAVQLKPGTGGLVEALARGGKIATGLRSSVSRVVLDDLPLEDGEDRDESQIRLQIVLRSHVAETVAWTKPVFDGGRIGLGPHIDGDGWAYLGVHTDNSLWPATFIGSLGSGKSAAVNGYIATIREAMPTTVVYIDGKGGSSSPELGRNCSVYITDESEFEEFAEAALRGVLYRQALLAKMGESGYTPSRELPVLMFVLDECHLLFRHKRIVDIWVQISTTSRSGGVGSVYASQHSGLRIFGGREELRSSALAGGIIGMRCTSRVAGGLLHPDLGDLRRMPTGGGWAYAIGQQVDRPGTMFRFAYLPSSKECPDGLNSETALARYPDVPLDAGTRAAIGEEWFDGPARRAAREAALDARIAHLTGGWRNQPITISQPSVPDMPSVPQPPSLTAAPEPAALSGRSAEVVAVVAQHPDGIRFADIAAELGWDHATTGTYLGRLVPEHLQRLGRGLYVRADSTDSTDSTTQQSESAGELQPRAYAHARETPIVDTPQLLSVVTAKERTSHDN